MTQQLFDDAIGTPPPSTVDIAAIVRRENRRAVACRTVVTMAGVVALSVAVVAGLSLVQARPPVHTPIERLPTILPTAESAEAKASRVSAAWQQATAKVLLGAKWKAWHDGSVLTPAGADYYDEQASLTPPATVTSDRLSYTAGLVEVAGVEGKLHFRTCLTSTGSDFYCPRDGTCLKPCAVSSGPNGEVIRVRRSTEKVDGYKLPYVQLTVWIGAADGTRSAEITLDNVLGPDGAEQSTTMMPLTEEQIIAILLEPGLMI